MLGVSLWQYIVNFSLVLEMVTMFKAPGVPSCCSFWCVFLGKSFRTLVVTFCVWKFLTAWLLHWFGYDLCLFILWFFLLGRRGGREREREMECLKSSIMPYVLDSLCSNWGKVLSFGALCNTQEEEMAKLHLVLEAWTFERYGFEIKWGQDM